VPSGEPTRRSCPEPLPTTSVVMATHRRRRLLRQVLDALLADPALTEAIVVVDGSRDGSLELLRTLTRLDSRVRPLWTENVGASRAQQLGLEQAAGEVVLMFDDDQLASPGLVTGHAAHHGRGERRVVVGWPPTPVPLRRAGSFVVEVYAEAYEEDCRAWERDPGLILETLWGGNVSLRRSELLAIGWHDPDVPAGYHYDHDFGLRCRQAGLEGVFDRRLHALHLYTRTPAAYLREARAKGRAIVQIQRRHAGLADHYAVGRPWETTRRRRLALRLRRLGLARSVGLPVLRAAGVARRYGFEGRLGNALWDLEMRAGMLDELRRGAVPPERHEGPRRPPRSSPP
jgi:glycosyltransferase involved in cell wall biosynthesis